MSTQSNALHTDTDGKRTSSVYGDDGAGTSRWFQWRRTADGGDAGVGATSDAAVTDPTAAGGVIALLKGLLTGSGEVADTAETDPAQSGSVIALLKGILTGVNASAPADPATTAATTALSTSLVVKASAGQLLSFVGYSTIAQFIQVHDAAALPADTAVPLAVIPITAGAPFSLDLGELGLDCAVGIVLSNSTTGPTKTLGAADTFITAVYR